MENTSNIIKHTGTFDEVDRLYGDIDAAKNGGSSESSDDSEGGDGGDFSGGGGGGFGGGGLDFGDEGGDEHDGRGPHKRQTDRRGRRVVHAKVEQHAADDCDDYESSPRRALQPHGGHGVEGTEEETEGVEAGDERLEVHGDDAAAEDGEGGKIQTDCGKSYYEAKKNKQDPEYLGQQNLKGWRQVMEFANFLLPCGTDDRTDPE